MFQKKKMEILSQQDFAACGKVYTDYLTLIEMSGNLHLEKNST